MPDASVSELRSFAREHTKKGGIPCITCALPDDLLKVLRQGRREGVAFTVMSDYLRQKNIVISEDALSHHWRKHER